jgi:HPt (histidine-containing phosphotransfer) domain-containing protein
MSRTDLIENPEVEHSQYASDPEMRGIVSLFVEDLPKRAGNLRSALANGDRGRLRTLAHQLRGSAGGYGFPGIGNAAANVEILILSGAADERIENAVDRLARRCLQAAAPDRSLSRLGSVD